MSKEFKRYQKEIAGRMLTVDINRVAAQANGAAFIKYGDTTVLSTCTASEKPRDGIDFFPLSVEYEEKLYSVGKIPGGFNKREGKASENAVLTSRVIDRPMRPLFPKDYRNDVTLNNLVMSESGASVHTLQICVCPLVNIAEPWTLGMMSTSAASGLIWLIARPSGLL